MSTKNEQKTPSGLSCSGGAKPNVGSRFYLHVGANGSCILKGKKAKDNPYYTATHVLYLKPVKRRRITQNLVVGAICNDVYGNIYKILSFKPCR